MIAKKSTLTTYIHFLSRVILFIRVHAQGPSRISDEQLFDLMDAIHNIPDMLMRYGESFTDQEIRKQYLAPYDQKWGESGIRLIPMLDDMGNKEEG